MAGRKVVPLVALTLASTLALSACGIKESLGVDGEPRQEIDKSDERVIELNERAKSYWHALSEGDSVAAFDFLSTRCKDERIATSEVMLSSYEQRHINKMAYTRHTTDELINSLDTSITSISSGNQRARVSLNSSIEGISMSDLRWQRSDVDNKWYLDSCRPPFDGQADDQSSYRLERERDVKAYREGMIEDDGNYRFDPEADLEPDTSEEVAESGY